jgi:hypothetical protein
VFIEYSGQTMFAVPQLPESVWSIVIISVGAGVLANIVAVLPSRINRETSAALLLRTE